MKRLLTITFLAICVCSFCQKDVIVTKNDTVYGKITGFSDDRIEVRVYQFNRFADSYIEWDNVVYYHFNVIENLRSSFDSAAIYTIQTSDKSEYIGRISDIWNDSIAFKTDYLGRVIIRAEHIKKIRGESYYESKQGDTWFENPNETRYLFGPSAYNLKKGEGYYQNVYAIVNMANVGITDYISIGGGLEFVSTFSGYPTVFLTPKLGFPIGEKFGVSTGVIAGVVGGGEAYAGIIYGVGTYGSKEHNATFGLGYGFIDDAMSESPIITFSGMTRVGRKVSLVSENWFVPTRDGYYGFVTYGIRLFGPKMSFDIALINNGDIIQEIPIGVPYIDFVIKF